MRPATTRGHLPLGAGRPRRRAGDRVQRGIRLGDWELDAGAFVARLSPEGTVLWARTLASGGRTTRVAVDGAGNVSVGGALHGDADLGGGALSNAGDADGFVAKYDVNGSHRWSRSLGSVDDDTVWDVAADAAGRTFVAGAFRGHFEIDDRGLTSAGGYGFVAAFAP